MTEVQDQREASATVKYHKAIGGFYVGQEGEFLLRDSCKRPIETVSGKIITLMEGKTALYAMLSTDRGMRPGRLA